jgi:hypothetical protein
MATKKRTKKRVDLPALPVRSQGKRADWDMVKKLVAWFNEHSDRDSEVAIDLALAAAHAITVTTGGDPQDLDERYDEIRDLITVPATMQPLSPGGDA